MIVSNGEKFIKLLMDICQPLFIQIQIGKIFLTLLKIKITEKKKIFTSQSVRSQNYEYAYDLLQNFIIKKPKKYWFEQFKNKGIASQMLIQLIM